MVHPARDSRDPVPRTSLCEPFWAAGLGAAVAAACILHPQAAMHGYDVYPLLAWFGTGSGHPQHPLYLPLGELLQSVLGTSPYESLLVLSALATGLAAAFVHATARILGFDQVLALAATLVFALLPAVVHFGTVAEMHAPFVAAYGCCWLLAARWRNCSGVGLALVLGALSGAATMLHATGHLAVLVLGPSWCLLASRRPWACARALGALLVAHATVWGVGFLCLQHLRPPLHDDDPVRFLARHWEAAGLVGASGHALWAEWLLPFLPVSLVLPVVAAIPQWRRAGSWALLVVAGYVLLSGILLWSRNLEYGSYLLVLAAPLVLLCAAALPRTLTWLMVPMAAAATLHHLGSVDREPADPVFGVAVAESVAAVPAMVVVGGFGERDGAVQRLPHARIVAADELLAPLGTVPLLDANLVRSWLAQQVAGAPGRAVLFSPGALDRLRTAVPTFDEAVGAPPDGLAVESVELAGSPALRLRAR